MLALYFSALADRAAFDDGKGEDVDGAALLDVLRATRHAIAAAPAGCIREIVEKIMIAERVAVDEHFGHQEKCALLLLLASIRCDVLAMLSRESGEILGDSSDDRPPLARPVLAK